MFVHESCRMSSNEMILFALKKKKNNKNGETSKETIVSFSIFRSDSKARETRERARKWLPARHVASQKAIFARVHVFRSRETTVLVVNHDNIVNHDCNVNHDNSDPLLYHYHHIF